LVAKANDIDSLTKCLNTLIGDQELRAVMSENNTERVKEFDSYIIAGKYLDFMGLKWGE
jgi:hypothetical protein